MVGGFKRRRDFPDFQRFGRLQPLSNGLPSHGIPVPAAWNKNLPKMVGKNVLLTYI